MRGKATKAAAGFSSAPTSMAVVIDPETCIMINTERQRHHRHGDYRNYRPKTKTSNPHTHKAKTFPRVRNRTTANNSWK